jgi:ribonuclease HI
MASYTHIPTLMGNIEQIRVNRNLYERCPGDQTNNRAELIAIVRLLETVPPPSQSTSSNQRYDRDDKYFKFNNPEKASSVDKPRKLIIRTDSKYSISCIEQWHHGWAERDWKNKKGEDVKNKVGDSSSLVLSSPS